MNSLQIFQDGSRLFKFEKDGKYYIQGCQKNGQYSKIKEISLEDFENEDKALYNNP